MNTMYKHRLVAAILPALFLSCSKDKEETISVPVSAPTAVSAVVPAPPPEPEKKSAGGLAMLTKLKNRADMRAHNQTVWQAAPTGTEFVKHDALQTHTAATANVRYESGSSLDLRENTLVIFDKDPGANSRSPDRVLLKNGRIIGKTKKELWVFTTSGLVQIKPVKKNQQAEASLGIDTPRKLNLTVTAGAAEVILKKDAGTFQKFSVAENSDFSFTAPADFSVNSDSASVPAVKAATQAELVIEAPADNTVSTTPELEVRGRLTDLGAKLLINGQLAEIGEDLTFKKVVSLTEGTNLVVFQMVRSDASVKFYRKNIRYDKNR